MKTIIDEANQILTTHELVTAKEYRRIIKALIAEVSQAYEDGCNVVTTTQDFTTDELYIAERMG